MPGNTAPIYSRVGDIQWSAAAVASANTAKDGTGTVTTVFSADATNGGRIDKLRCKALGTNVQTVLRVFINNGSANTTAANNVLYAEKTLPATTLSETTEIAQQEVPLNLALPPGYRINVTIGTTVAAGWMVTGVGGKY